MKTLVVGASGATGKHLVQQLLNSGTQVKVIVRSTASIPEHWKNNDSISVITTNISELNEHDLAIHLQDCDAAVSCLGHNMTLKGIYGNPRKLVTNTVKKICEAFKINSPEKPVKFILMNTAGNQNRDLSEPISFGEKVAIGLLRLLLPPHTDNEMAADHLRLHVGRTNPDIEWVVVRPDTLIDQDFVSKYKIYASPTRSALFNPGKTSRINVGHFIAELLTKNELWLQWKGQMPVIYNEQ